MVSEDEWDTCDSVGRALQRVNRATQPSAGWQRKFRLFGCYALRCLAPHAKDTRFEHALDVGERVFDGLAVRAELTAAIADAQRGFEMYDGETLPVSGELADSLRHLLSDHAFRCAYDASGTVLRFDFSLAHSPERDAASAKLAKLVREMFGNPFRPVAFDPTWRTSTAVAVARQMYETRDFTAMPILADALQDAGCDSDDVLNHSRSNGVHVRGCWVVDLVLGKT